MQNGQEFGPSRVWVMNEQIPGLAMSRSFGDYIASRVGVISEPEIVTEKIDFNEGFIVLASDGIWEFMSNEKVVEIVKMYWRSDMNS